LFFGNLYPDLTPKMQPRTVVAHYEILSAIGRGGMGEVWKAHDSRLGRDVAIKTLPSEFSSDTDRLARFQREARLLASLNHPGIAAIYGLEESGGSRFLVLELVEGETLADRLKRGAIPLDESIRLALQISAAIEAAHEKGVIHRDLKPANIKVTPDGKVKVLDFGLATVFAPEKRDGSLSDSPTLTMSATQQGIILGTAAYMSPEQARGEQVDKRSDIWSFGVVLYEMVTGKRLFEGNTVTDTLAAVLLKPPDFESAPVSVRKLLRACLERDPRRRLRDIGEVWRLVEDSDTEHHADRKTGSSGVLWVALVAIALLALIALWAPWRSTPERPLVRLDVDLGQDVFLSSADQIPLISVAISPDGNRIAYSARSTGGPTRLFTRRLDEPKVTELSGTAGAMGPVFSPDGRWIGFYADNKFNKVSVEGGTVVPLGDVPGFPGGADWAEADTIIVAGMTTAGPGAGGLARIRSSGGTPIKVTDATGELGHVRPQTLPGGKAVLFGAYPGLITDKHSVDVIDLVDGHRKTILPGAASARYLPTSNGSGYLLYVKKGTLFAISFDLNLLETRGDPVPIVNDLAYQYISDAAQYDVSPNGTLVYRKASGTLTLPAATIQWLIPGNDGEARKERLREKPDFYSSPQLSRDGSRMAMLVSNQGEQDVWVYDFRQDRTTRLTIGGGPYTQPIWGPDGRFVFFASFSGSISWTRSDGAGQPQPLSQSKDFQIPMAFTSVGNRLAYVEAGQIWTVAIEETNGKLQAGKPELFVKSEFNMLFPSFSPDGKWLAYSWIASGGNPEIYVRAFPDTGGRWQISNNLASPTCLGSLCGGRPVWSPNGKDILYQSGDEIMAVAYTTRGDAFVADKPRVWLTKLSGQDWDLAANGQRVAVVTPETQVAPRQDHEVVFLMNFIDELRRKVPTK
jgi:serine/threonine-protein kinase